MPENIRALWGLSNNSRSDKTRPSYVLPYKHLARLDCYIYLHHYDE